MSCIIAYEIQSYLFSFAIAKENISLATGDINFFLNRMPNSSNSPTLKNRFIHLIKASGLALRALLLCLPLINKIPQLSPKDTVIKALSKDGTLLEYALLYLKESEGIVKAAVEKRPEALEVASKEVVSGFIKQSRGFLKYASNELKEDPNFILEFIQEVSNSEWESHRTPCPKLLAFCSTDSTLAQIPKILEHTSLKLKENADFMTRAVEKNHWAFLACASKEVEDAVLKAMKEKCKDLSGIKKFTQNKAPLNIT